MRLLHSLDRKKKPTLALWSVLLAASLVLPSISLAQTKPGPPPAENAAFSQVWQRADMPVAQGRAQRSWLWGPAALTTRSEPLVESPGGFRQVQYYDKARMEVNNPSADPNSAGYVTNGLLVTEMLSGRLQVGVNKFEQRDAASIPVAGDVSMTVGPAATTPTYKALAAVASLAPGQNQAQSKIGQTILEMLDASGRVTTLPNNISPASLRYQHFEPTSKHNIPDVFWTYMNQRGIVHEGGQYRQGLIFNWLSAMGYPLTEPYWIEISISGKKSLVLMQAFERRVLTYNPTNAPEWRVEMGNVGMQYLQWRYNAAPAPQPGGGTTLSIRRPDMPDTLKTGNYSGIEQSLYQAIADQKAWDDLWVHHTAKLDAFLPTPTVDFRSEFVVAAFWGNKPNGCYSLKIESVSLKQGALQVTVNQAQRDGGCTQVITQPNDIVLVSRAGLPAGKLAVSFLDPGGKEIAAGALTLP